MRPTRIPLADVAAIVSNWPTLHGYAKHIAETYGIPLGTARGWVAETRRRGLLAANAEHPCPTCGGSGTRAFGVKAS